MRSVINVVFLGACRFIIFRRMEFRSTGQREVGEKIVVCILIIKLGRSIDLQIVSYIIYINMYTNMF